MELSWNLYLISMISSVYFSKKKPDQVSDQAGGFSFGHKKALHLHVRLFVLLIIVMPNHARLSVLVGFMSKEWMKIDSVGTFKGGSYVYTAGCATGSLTQLALTGFGYLY